MCWEAYWVCVNNMEGGRDKLAGFSKRLVGKEKQVGVRIKGVVTV